MKSLLAVFDLTTQTSHTVLAVDRHIEAPNWVPDGKSLIVNGEGRLFRVPLDAPELLEIDTGFAVNCNNDHGISPDGQTLVISDKSEDGASTIYTLPIDGGTPKRVTQKSPSYWHGWSPDGTTLTYVAKRGASFQVFTIPASGGDETQLTHDFDHCDGPDYTPDGEWIWFNGEKDGFVDLWRMKPDGSDLQPMTQDASVNWFPHPSPDGQHVLYLAYPKGTTGHPFGKTVVLRVMPSNGGTPSDLTTVYGGQGTINVPCWAPDSSAFAYMHFED